MYETTRPPGMSATCLAALGVLASGSSLGQDPATPAPLIDRDETLKISDHVYIILDDNVGFVPNVGIVVGDRATLVIDTGLGERNGERVLEETRKISTHEELYVASTHYHAEHDLGAPAFPDSAQMIRSRDQQRDIDEFGLSQAERFSRMSPTMAELLDGAEFRDADIYFDDEYNLDLGGVTVRMLAVGPAHTQGDTVFLIEEDRVLFSGDVAMRWFPGIRTPNYGVAAWRESLEQLAELDVDLIVPSHGPTGDASMIQVYDDYFATIESRVAELKTQGRSADDIAELMIAEIGPRYPDWPEEDVDLIGNAARSAFEEAP